MRLSKITGIAAAVAFASGLAMTGTACAVPSGTQVEYNANGTNEAIANVESFVFELVLVESLAGIGL